MSDRPTAADRLANPDAVLTRSDLGREPGGYFGTAIGVPARISKKSAPSGER
jgi:hypothetical protein